MGKNKGMPRYYGKNIAMQAERRYLAGGKPESKRVEENREASANVISMEQRPASRWKLFASTPWKTSMLTSWKGSSSGKKNCAPIKRQFGIAWTA